MERDHLESQKNDVLEQRNRLERAKEKLVRENEKLKNDNKNNRRMMYGASQVSSQIPTYLQKFSTKEGAQNTSFGGTQVLNVNHSHSSAKFAFKNFIGDGLEKFGDKYNDSEKSGTDLSGAEDNSQKENQI